VSCVNKCFCVYEYKRGSVLFMLTVMSASESVLVLEVVLGSGCLSYVKYFCVYNRGSVASSASVLVLEVVLNSGCLSCVSKCCYLFMIEVMLR
jgi:hypothetical protein